MNRGTLHAVRVPRREGITLHRFRSCLWLLACGVWLCEGSQTAQAAAPITRIEEDWQIELDQPDPDTIAPQILNVISPTSSLTGKYAIFELNHRTCGDYGPGGVQLQTWDGDALKNFTSPNFYDILATPNETITYTLGMSLQFGLLKFEVKNGSSTTWGNFGGGSALRLWTTTNLSAFSTYDPAKTVENSGIGFASHRVVRFVLKEVRYYADDTLIATDPTDRFAFDRAQATSGN
jgi:hypothetical protein